MGFQGGSQQGFFPASQACLKRRFPVLAIAYKSVMPRLQLLMCTAPPRGYGNVRRHPRPASSKRTSATVGPVAVISWQCSAVHLVIVQ